MWWPPARRRRAQLSGTRAAVRISSPEYYRARPTIQPGNVSSVSAGDARGERLLETQASIQRRCDIDHVYALEELVPWWGRAKSHSSGSVFPDRNHDARYIRCCGAALKSFLYPRLLGGRALAERTIDRNDNHVLTIASQVRHLKRGHRANWLRTSFSHVSLTFSPMRKMGNADSISPTVGFLSLGGLTPSTRKPHRYLCRS